MLTKLDIIEDSATHFARATDMCKDADEVIITSYGIYAGIIGDGRNARDWADCPAQDFLDSLTAPTVVLIADSPVKPCKVGCEFCAAKQRKQDKRLNLHFENWENIEWIHGSDLHLKVIAARHGDDWQALIGGRNLSDSNWTDLSYHVEGDAAASVAGVAQFAIKSARNQ